jgi:8-oxo-dGTP pyrophosphatase MutT (NUDIX family)
MSEHDLTATAEATMHGAVAAGSELPIGEQQQKKGKKEKKLEKALEERKVYEAGGVIVCDGKVVLRLTDKQHWIFPKGKLKKHESPVDAAVREATEETGLKVSVVEQVADLLIRHEGKKRRFVFYLMQATAKTWDWPHHEGRDTFLISPDRVSSLVRHAGYSSVWQACQEKVKGMCDEPTPFVSRHVAIGGE